MIAHVGHTDHHLKLYLDNEFIDPHSSVDYFAFKRSRVDREFTNLHEVQILDVGQGYAYLINRLSEYEILVFHFMGRISANVICGLPESTCVVWVLWGDDYYKMFPNLYSSILLPKTLWIAVLTLKLEPLLLWILGKVTTRPYTAALRLKHKAASRVDYYVNNLGSHADIFSLLPVKKSLILGGVYYSIESLTKGIDLDVRPGPHVYVGNSASLTSNHADIFDMLSHRGITNERNVVVTLSYGSRRIRKVIESIGYRKFGERFKPIRTWLPLVEYHKLLQSCSYAIFNHIRAQGVGHIIFLIYLGLKIFLRNENPIRKFFVSKGILTFSIQDDLPNGLGIALSETQIYQNRRRLSVIFSSSQIRKNVEALEKLDLHDTQ